MKIDVVVEIPKGSRNKYEIDHRTGKVWLDRHLFTSMAYPADYGYVDETLAEDGDALDAMVLLDEPTYPGVHILARPIAVFWMRDEKGPDAKLLCVPSGDPRWSDVTDLANLRNHRLEEISHFFEVYKALEPDKYTEIGAWEGVTAAEAAIEDARARYLTRYDHEG